MGLSGRSGDSRNLIASEVEDACTADDLFCHELARKTGAVVARLGGMDGLVFTGGARVGQPPIRERVANTFGWAA